MQWPYDSATTATILFAGTQLITGATFLTGWRFRRKNLVAGLYEEVRFNLKAIDAFLDKANDPPVEMMNQVTKDRQYRPHILYAQQAKFYEANLTKLPTTDRELNRLLVDFYSDLESLEVEVEAVQFPSFATVLNRANVIQNIWTTTKKAKTSGEKARSFIEGRYKHVVT